MSREYTYTEFDVELRTGYSLPVIKKGVEVKLMKGTRWWMFETKDDTGFEMFSDNMWHTKREALEFAADNPIVFYV